MRVLRDFGVGKSAHRAVRDHHRTEALESRPAERGVLRKQEVAAPEALARDRAVGLAVDGENDAGCVLRLRNAAHDHQNVPVRIRIDGAWAQRVRRERHGIVISVVVGERGAPRAGMDAVPDDLHQFGK